MVSSGEPLRVDKWLWCIRACKTRSEAAEACRSGRVRVNEVEAKASRELKVGDTVSFRKSPITCTYKVIGFPKSRVAAKLVAEFADDQTPQAERDKLHVDRLTIFVQREKGTGRPTKKDRRQLDFLMGKGSASQR
ncbi:MAG: RNA-binding S4 domain-containing protein [Prevotellaceae bacterium]|jgi:ribosome-associated heat shock protein Hsp15|nr:RNA-binding S4 domain-containing protein [Prevotellaceae bacterium]